MISSMEDLWVVHLDGREFNLSNVEEARAWLRCIEISDVFTNTGSRYGIDECPDHLILEFCRLAAKQLVVGNGVLH